MQAGDWEIRKLNSWLQTSEKACLSPSGGHCRCGCLLSPGLERSAIRRLRKEPAKWFLSDASSQESGTVCAIETSVECLPLT